MVEDARSSHRSRPSRWITAIRARFAALIRRIEQLGGWLDNRPTMLMVALAMAYLILTLPHAYFAPLWHDELFTYNLAISPSLSQMLHNLLTQDLNPPVLYLLDYIAVRLPGANASDQFTSLAARLPSLAGGLIASLGLFAMVRKRLGPLYAFACVGFLWNTLFLSYTWEDRPYALVTGLLTLLVMAWSRATRPRRSFFWVGLTLAIAIIMVGSHFMGSFLLLAFLGAELVRAWQVRRLDIPLAICFIVPVVIPVAYNRTVHGYGATVFPAAFQASISTFALDYLALLSSCLYILLAFIVLRMIAAMFPQAQRQGAADMMVAESHGSGVTLPEWTLIIGILMEPVIAILLIMRLHGAFFWRYGLPGCVPIAILSAAFIGWQFRFTKRIALFAILASGIGPLYALGNLSATKDVPYPEVTRGESATNDYHAIEPELPLVTASALTYVEMNHRESPEFLHRVYYLTDTQAAIQYAHATLFEGEAETNRTFHFEGRVESLQNFEAAHARFLVLGTYSYPEDWLLRKLHADGDTLRYLGRFSSGYKDHELYEVTLKITADHDSPRP
jgi:hypothetical protein